MSEISDDVSFFMKQLDELAQSFRMTLASNILSGIGLFGYFITLNELLMLLSIFSSVLSLIVSITSLYRFFVFLRDRNREVSSR